MTSTFPSFWTSPHRGPTRWSLTFSGVVPSSKTHTSIFPDPSVSRSFSTALSPGPIWSEPRPPSRPFDRSMLTSPATAQPARASGPSNAHVLPGSPAGGAAQGSSWPPTNPDQPATAKPIRPTNKIRFSICSSLHEMRPQCAGRWRSASRGSSWFQTTFAGVGGTTAADPLAGTLVAGLRPRLSADRQADTADRQVSSGLDRNLAHRNPKRERGTRRNPSLTLRVTMIRC